MEGDGIIDGYDRKLSGGVVVGIVVGFIFGIVFVVFFICCLSRIKCSFFNEEKFGIILGIDFYFNFLGL